MKKFLLMFAVASVGFSMSSRAQLTQNFEGTSGTALPAGWSQNTATLPGWMTGTYTSFPAGQWANYMNVIPHTRYAQVTDASSSNLNTGDTLISPSFNVAGLNAPFLTFDHLYGGYSYQSGPAETATVLISVDSGAWTSLFTIPGGGSWATEHIDLSAYASDTSVRIAFTYADAGGYLMGLAVDNISIVSLPTNDIQLSAVTPASGDPLAAFGATGTTLPLGGTVQNNGSATISAFNVNYQVGTNTVVTTPITGVSIPTYGTFDFSATDITLPATPGTYNVKVWVSLVADTNATNDSGATVVGAYDATHKPTKRLLMEEATGTWCGWCVRGIVYMDSLAELYGDGVSLVAVHNSDPMTVTAYDAFVTSFPGFTGFPNALVDRRELVDPGNLLDLYAAENTMFGFADVTIGARTLTGTSLAVPVTVTPAIPLTGDYRLIMSLTQDDVHAPANPTSTWLQHNYYSSIDAPTYNGGPLSGQGIDYVDSGTTLSNVYFAHVARAISPSAKGTNNLPTTMAAGTAYPVTLTTNVSSAWGTPSIKVVVMLVRGSDGVVLNSNNATIWPTAVSNVTANITHAALYPNPASTLSNVALELANASTVQITVTDMIGRQVYATPSEQYVAGKHNITFSTAAFTPGNYNVTISTSNGSVTQTLTVAK